MTAEEQTLNGAGARNAAKAREALERPQPKPAFAIVQHNEGAGHIAIYPTKVIPVPGKPGQWTIPQDDPNLDKILFEKGCVKFSWEDVLIELRQNWNPNQ